ncbi:hypothetical protein H4R21_003956, partial [Coemansia helicoidea]
MPSAGGDDDDAPQPRTLAERIARLGLEDEAGAKPSLQALGRRAPAGLTLPRSLTPLAGATPPPIAPKPALAARPPVPRPLDQRHDNHTAAQARRPLPSFDPPPPPPPPDANHDHDHDHAPPVSVKDRIHGLFGAAGSTSPPPPQPQPLSAGSNPFASPDLSEPSASP